MEERLDDPYQSLPPTSFWRRAVAAVEPETIDPVLGVPFTIGACDRVATAGSCFAQQLSRAIAARGFEYLVTEAAPATSGAVDENYGVFSARYGNIYTTVQLLQLFDRAYGVFVPDDDAWTRSDGSVIDPFRPRVQARGFDSVRSLRADRHAHLEACRKMFETCDVLVFTLGLTECWVSEADGAVVPFAPGAAGGVRVAGDYRFRNLTAAEVSSALQAFVDRLRVVNPHVAVVLTVSPVSIIATYLPQHVATSNGYSKAALRVAADEVARANPDVAYFPSFEMVQGPASAGRFLTSDRRHVTAEGVEHVMDVFCRHFLSTASGVRTNASVDPAPVDPNPTPGFADLVEMQGVVCDEELLDR